MPKSLLEFKSLNCPLKVVLGNNDIGEKEDLVEVSKEFNCEIHEEPYFVNIDNTRICILHHPDLIDEEIILKSDLILHGHTHRFRLDRLKDCIIFNPGECAGFMKDKNNIGLIDLRKMSPKIINF